MMLRPRLRLLVRSASRGLPSPLRRATNTRIAIPANMTAVLQPLAAVSCSRPRAGGSGRRPVAPPPASPPRSGSKCDSRSAVYQIGCGSSRCTQSASWSNGATTIQGRVGGWQGHLCSPLKVTFSEFDDPTMKVNAFTWNEVRKMGASKQATASSVANNGAPASALAPLAAEVPLPDLLSQIARGATEAAAKVEALMAELAQEKTKRAEAERSAQEEVRSAELLARSGAGIAKGCIGAGIAKGEAG